MDQPAFARSGDTDPLGELGVRIDCNVPEQMKDDAAFVARASGFKNTSEWLRDILHRELYGRVETVQRLVRGNGNVNRMNKG